MTLMAKRRIRAPDFLIIGAMKAGTTTLYSDLRSHRSIFMPAIKEPANLVDDTIHTARGVSRYLRLFSTARPDQRCGEASTHYTSLPVHTGAPEAAMAVAGPDVRLIYLIRDPVERALSHHRHLYSRGSCSPDLGVALSSHPAIAEYSRYDIQLEQWLRHYPAAQVAVVRFEMYVAERTQVVSSVLRFLNATSDPEWLPGPARNASVDRRRPSAMLGRIRQSRGTVRGLASRAPESLKRSIRRALTHPVDLAAIDVSDAALGDLISRLAPVRTWMAREAADLELQLSPRKRQLQHD